MCKPTGRRDISVTLSVRPHQETSYKCNAQCATPPGDIGPYLANGKDGNSESGETGERGFPAPNARLQNSPVHRLINTAPKKNSKVGDGRDPKKFGIADRATSYLPTVFRWAWRIRSSYSEECCSLSKPRGCLLSRNVEHET